MHVTGIHPHEEIYNYNSIRINVLRKQIVEADAVNDAYDVKKAVSDMAKDFALMQYQHFVGDTKQCLAKGNAKTSFRTGESFAL